MAKAVLNDLDGLLVNSEKLYLEANQHYFRKYNLDFTEEMHRIGTGQKFDKWIKTVVKLDKSGEEILHERNLVFYELVKLKLQLNSGAEEYLKLVSRNFKNGLVTSSRQDYLDLVYQITGIYSTFDFTVTGEMVENGKPNPECYFLAAKTLGVEPEDCVVFEDSPSGVLAGKSAGMKVVAVPSLYVRGHEAFKKADLVINDLSEVTVEMINRLLDGTSKESEPAFNDTKEKKATDE